jgi:hypothetical protein
VKGNSSQGFDHVAALRGLVCGKGVGQRKELSLEERNEEFNERHKHCSKINQN